MKEKNYDLIIATTATTRPDLHSLTFKKYCDFLQGLDCLWLVGIDYLDLGPGSPTPEVTKINLENIMNEYSNIEHNITINLKKNGDYRGGCRAAFYRNALDLTSACVKLSHQARWGVFWLEDDWELEIDRSLVDILKDHPLEEKDYLQLVLRRQGEPGAKNILVSYNPGIFGTKLFKDLCYAGISRKDTRWRKDVVNPESAATWRKESHWCYPKVDGPPVKPRHHYVVNSFKDLGREWQNINSAGRRTFLL